MIDLSKEQEAVLDVLALRDGSVTVKQGPTPNSVEMLSASVSWVVLPTGRIIDQSKEVFTQAKASAFACNGVREDAYSDLVPDQKED